MFGNNAGGRGADVVNAKTGQHSCQAAGFGRLDAGEQVIGLSSRPCVPVRGPRRAFCGA